MPSKGYIAISTTLIVSVVVLAIAITTSFLSIGEAQSSLSLAKGEGVLALVEGCSEDALLRLRSDANYSGGSITRPEGVCSITQVSKVGTVYTFDISSTNTDYNHTIRIVVNRTGSGLTLVSWQKI